MYPDDETCWMEDRADRPTGDHVRAMADVLVELMSRYRSQYPDFEALVAEMPVVAT